ncbi:DUF357 domain-containing protein [Picrophilus oshimae]|uniref:DUF357 domain-containing protein n=1 Tax=Picrophilus torridus (strain ATCC 700027 / DSM 9790 / JCM 10055 / NBRC 100828 / KAW 2/3) TaxID=1122961 RepID=Q6L1W7_PICTO|nr:DUF357 domain-containing protein [Picrophilus oshimae]AAT43035.1 hypothetical protein PTO0450 [Picrophilus oshimae DSM 9789]SMD30663.1 hypothetical protein SAMN02745355_0556 [Picrophilus oshimae DSM 9789]
MDLKERVERYIKIEAEALDKIRIAVPETSHLMVVARDFLDMIRNYYNDALYFYDKNDLINAFAALNYSYGWIDAGIRLGIFYGGSDYRLFTQYK